MKKLIIVLLAMVMLLSVVGCIKEKESPTPTAAPVTDPTTEPVIDEPTQAPEPEDSPAPITQVIVADDFVELQNKVSTSETMTGVFETDRVRFVYDENWTSMALSDDMFMAFDPSSYENAITYIFTTEESYDDSVNEESLVAMDKLKNGTDEEFGDAIITTIVSGEDNSLLNPEILTSGRRNYGEYTLVWFSFKCTSTEVATDLPVDAVCEYIMFIAPDLHSDIFVYTCSEEFYEANDRPFKDLTFMLPTA